jgi:hypothetical protein
LSSGEGKVKLAVSFPEAVPGQPWGRIVLIGVSKRACCGRALLKSTDGFLTRVSPGTALGRDTVLFAVSLLGARRHIDNMGSKFNILFLNSVMSKTFPICRFEIVSIIGIILLDDMYAS